MAQDILDDLGALSTAIAFFVAQGTEDERVEQKREIRFGTLKDKAELLRLGLP